MPIKSMVIRLFPTKEQEIKMWQHIDASRYIWNYMLALQEERYKKGEKHLSAYGMNYLITPLKKEEDKLWLNNVSTATLQRSCADLAKAYDSFFKKIRGCPKFKSHKKDRDSFPLSDGLGKVWFSEKLVNVPKIGKVKYKTNYNVPQGNKQKFSDPRIKYTPNGKWILTLGIECENQVSVLTNELMGIDLGVKELAVVSYSNECYRFPNKNKSKRVQNKRNKLKHLQRNLMRKYRINGSYKETNQIKKLKKQISRLYYHISNIQKNYIHQITHSLIKMKPKRVIMEDLDIKGMMKNRNLARAIQEQSLYEFIRQMKYKCEWAGIDFIQADRFFPSSKTCSYCGAYKKGLKLSDRIFECPECGNKIDRDYNAAINLMKYKNH
jgi:putative transposase